MMNFFKKILGTPDIRRRIFITFLILAAVRLLSYIPVLGMSREEYAGILGSGSDAANGGVLGVLGLLSGTGGFESFSIIMMGVGPYITASIIIQMMTSVIPYLENLSQEGESGRAKIGMITKILSIPLTFLQGYAILNLLKTQFADSGLLNSLEGNTFMLALFSITIGSMIIVWLGDVISEYGVSNGISIIIFAGIVARLPSFFFGAGGLVEIIKESGMSFDIVQKYLIFGAISLAVLMLVVFITEGERQIQVSYAKRVRGNKMYGGASTYLPIKVNQGGVIPIIFAISFMNLPGVLAGLFQNAKTDWLRDWSQKVSENFTPANSYYTLFYFLLVVAFAYFYGVIALQPEKLSENLQKQGGYIPGIRPGKSTEQFLTKILNRVTLAGALFLGLMAVMPTMLVSYLDDPSLALGGTSLLIAVSVGIEVYRYLESQTTLYSYSSGRN